MPAKRLRVLLVCYYFPPVGGAGISRPLGLFRHLPEHGIDCDVLTVKPITYRVLEPELLDGLDESRIHRSGSTDPLRLLYLAGVRRVGASSTRRVRPASRRLFPDSKIGWVRKAVRLGSRLLKSNDYDAILSTSPPVSCHLVAQELVRRSGLPWIADFRDPWTSYTIEDWYHSPVLKARAQELLASIRFQSRAITGANQPIVDYVGGGIVIPTGFDPTRARLWEPPGGSERYVIGVLGTIDSLTPLTSLLQVLESARKQSPEIVDRITIRHVGRLDDDNTGAALVRHGFTGHFESHGVRDRRTTIELLSECAMMYLGIVPGHAEMLTPGRIFDLVASGRPILAHAGESSEVARIVHDLGNGHCFQVDDNTSCETAVRYVVKQTGDFVSGTSTVMPIPAYASAYSMDSTMARFAALIKDLAH